MATWLDYKELRERLRFVDVLKHFNVELKIRGDRATGLCPLPTHPKRTDGRRRSASFSAHLGRGIFQCFGCHAKGGVMDFGAIMLGHDPSNPGQFRQAALKLADLFSIECKREGNGDGGKQSEQKHPAGLSGVESPITQLPTGGSPEPQSSFPSSFTRTIINEPIDFVLKNLDPKHPYLSGRGFTPETIEHFGLGFCSRGLMKDRIAVPIHDPAGRLVGYAGRLVDDAKIDETHPKYLLPGRRERDGTTYEFHKSLLLYNLHRIGRKLSDLIIVEGFASTWWLHQCGFWDNVALMGGSCSDEQANLIAAIAARVWIMSDGDDAGENCAESLWQRLGTRLHCRHVKLDRGRQPTDVPKDDLHRLFKQNHKD